MWGAHSERYPLKLSVFAAKTGVPARFRAVGTVGTPFAIHDPNGTKADGSTIRPEE